jgi:hypothetical protein
VALACLVVAGVGAAMMTAADGPKFAAVVDAKNVLAVHRSLRPCMRFGMTSRSEIGQVAALPQSPTCFATALVPDQSQRAGPPVGLGWRLPASRSGDSAATTTRTSSPPFTLGAVGPSSGLRPFLNEPSLSAPLGRETAYR